MDTEPRAKGRKDSGDADVSFRDLVIERPEQRCVFEPPRPIAVSPELCATQCDRHDVSTVAVVEMTGWSR
jgi:hypothetical protein